MASPRCDRYHGLPVYPLVDVLAQLPLPPNCPLTGVSRKWGCVIAPLIPNTSEDDEKKLFDLVNRGIPCFLSHDSAQTAYGPCGGDAMTFLQDDRWTRFPKPQVAVQSGWGSPGTALETSNYHKLIHRFEEVFDHRAGANVPMTEEELKEVLATAELPGESISSPTTADLDPTEEVLEMQLFHRDDPTSCPPLPPLGNALPWPTFMEDAAVCDVSTSIAQRGSTRWWRLNDAGECVLQAALPLTPDPLRYSKLPTGTTPQMDTTMARCISATLSALAPSPHSIPVKLILSAAKGSYDWFMHDDEAAVHGKVVALDLFNTPDEALPTAASLLPILSVAVLYSGGSPLLTPPNLPTMTVALNDHVVIAHHRISYLWLDEVSFFLARCAGWGTTPMIYEYVEKDCQDAQYLTGHLIPTLMEIFRRHDGHNPYDAGIRERTVLSLYAIAYNDRHFNVPPDSRTSLLRLLNDPDSAIGAVLHRQLSYYPVPPGSSSADTIKHYWDVHSNWPKPGCVMSTWNGNGNQLHIPVVYNRHCIIYGSEKKTLEETVREYFDMKHLESNRHELLVYLRSRKTTPDELLNHLF